MIVFILILFNENNIFVFYISKRKKSFHKYMSLKHVFLPVFGRQHGLSAFLFYSHHKRQFLHY